MSGAGVGAGHLGMVTASPRSRSWDGRAAGSPGSSMPSPGLLAPHRHPPGGRRSPRRSRRRAARARRSFSERANRQVRTWPSAVSRVRSQLPQKGRVTEAMTPTPGRAATGALPAVDEEALGGGAAPARPGRARRAKRVWSEARICSAVTMRSRCQGVARVERHLLDDPQLEALLEGPGQQVGRLVVVQARHQHRIDLDRGHALVPRGGEAREDVGEPVAAGDLGEAIRAQGVEGDVDPVEARGGEALRAADEPEAVGGHRGLGARLEGRGRGHDVLEARGAGAARRR